MTVPPDTDEHGIYADDHRPGDLAWLGCALCFLSAVLVASVAFTIIHFAT